MAWRRLLTWETIKSQTPCTWFHISGGHQSGACSESRTFSVLFDLPLLFSSLSNQHYPIFMDEYIQQIQPLLITENKGLFYFGWKPADRVGMVETSAALPLLSLIAADDSWAQSIIVHHKHGIGAYTEPNAELYKGSLLPETKCETGSRV